MIGASGAIAGVLGAYFLLFPGAHVLVLFFFFFIHMFRVPAMVFLAFWFAYQLLSTTAGGGIAWYAHIGGFLAGALAILVIGRGEKRLRRYKW
jgi:membrane associated rhomboid family serine protease